MVNTTLLVGGRIYSPAEPDATAMVVQDGVVVWLGADEAGHAQYGAADEVLHLAGSLVTPAFVDAHVHATATGLLMGGLDLTGTTSLTDCLDAVHRYVVTHPDTVVWGHGWDETHWPERRPPSRAELDRATGGVAVYLSRIDAHSAVVSSALLSRTPEEVTELVGSAVDGPLTREAHHHVRRAASAAISPGQRRRAQGAFLCHAAAHGVAVVHECAGPDVSGVDDLRDLLAAEAGVAVVGYWGQAVRTAEEARELLAATGAHGLSGDLFCDGALGSRTAALHMPYTDAPDSCGARYLDAEEVAAHLVACTQARIQAGFHVIGDAATTTVLRGFALAESRLGSSAVRQARGHRLEHLEMIEAGQAQALGRWAVVASVQPAFDAAWGGPTGMYAQRLGARRAAGMNPFAMLSRTGMGMAFGSDTPVTPLDPWAAVRAAVQHRTAGSRISPTAAFTAHTQGGYRAAGCADPAAGALVPGTVASYAIWEEIELIAGLPVLGSDVPLPRCLRTVHRGRTVFAEPGALQ